jgi:hypothetical protein
MVKTIITMQNSGLGLSLAAWVVPKPSLSQHCSGPTIQLRTSHYSRGAQTQPQPPRPWRTLCSSTPYLIHLPLSIWPVMPYTPLLILSQKSTSLANPLATEGKNSCSGRYRSCKVYLRIPGPWGQTKPLRYCDPRLASVGT